MRAQVMTIVLLGCGHPAPQASAPPPVEAAAISAPDAAEPDPVSDHDSREVGIVQLAYGYRTEGHDVYLPIDDHDDDVKACFERAFPRSTRPSFGTLYAYLVVPNADADLDHATYFEPIASGVVTQPGTYPAFEACVRAAVGIAHAPPDAMKIEVFVQVSSRGVEGVMGHGGG